MLFKVNPSGQLTECHLGSAYMVALVSAMTGHTCNVKVGNS